MEENGGKEQKAKEKNIIKSGSHGKGEKQETRGERNREDKQRVKDEFPGGSVKLYWCVSLSLIVSLPWL